MGRSKVKAKVVKSTMGNKDVLEMFQNMVGVSDDDKPSGDTRILYPKYEKLRTGFRRYLKLFDLLAISTAAKNNTLILRCIVNYIADVKSAIDGLFTLPELT